jgi:hypothetical protein
LEVKDPYTKQVHEFGTLCVLDDHIFELLFSNLLKLKVEIY